MSLTMLSLSPVLGLMSFLQRRILNVQLTLQLPKTVSLYIRMPIIWHQIFVLYLIGSFPFDIARSELAPGQHNLQVYSRKTGEAIPDNIVGGAHFYIECKCPLHRCFILLLCYDNYHLIYST